MPKKNKPSEQDSPTKFDTDLFHATGIRPKRNQQKTRGKKLIGWFK
jgi:hypothetical protein